MILKFTMKNFVLSVLLLPIFLCLSFPAFAASTKKKSNEDKDIHVMQAVRDSDYETLQKILKDKANPDAKDSMERTALMIAARDNNLKAAKILILAGADVNIKNRTEGKTALIYAATYGYEKMVKLLLKKGALIDVKDLEGKTALIYAVIFDRPAVVKVLIDNKANIFSRTDSDESAMSIANSSGRIKISEMLKQAGAKD
ncbi:MAG: ankyrin repeat domain-containing protein [Leptospiraceae bacterium]|nr:ankyrin repeat domain-containing protein [Leptospiraceae bacterium]MCP5498890.1 ankyrin repeat domain-containing protein [Leptospiraceae bacterium]